MCLLILCFSLQIIFILVQDDYKADFFNEGAPYSWVLEIYTISEGIFSYFLNLSLLLQAFEWFCASQIILYQKDKLPEEIYANHMMQKRSKMLVIKPDKRCQYLKREVTLTWMLFVVLGLQVCI